MQADLVIQPGKSTRLKHGGGDGSGQRNYRDMCEIEAREFVDLLNSWSGQG